MADGLVTAKTQVADSISREDALKQLYLVDKDGLMTSSREGVESYQRQFTDARTDLPDGMSLLEVIKEVQPDILIGLSGVGGLFKEEHCRAMCEY